MHHRIKKCPLDVRFSVRTVRNLRTNIVHRTRIPIMSVPLSDCPIQFSKKSLRTYGPYVMRQINPVVCACSGQKSFFWKKMRAMQRSRIRAGESVVSIMDSKWSFATDMLQKIILAPWLSPQTPFCNPVIFCNTNKISPIVSLHRSPNAWFHLLHSISGMFDYQFFEKLWWTMDIMGLVYVLLSIFHFLLKFTNKKWTEWTQNRISRGHFLRTKWHIEHFNS